MPENAPKTTLDHPISGDRAEQLANDLQHQKSRLVIKEVVEEHIGSADFAKRIKDIASESLESTVTYRKISDKVQTQIDTTLNDRNLKNKNFVITNIISASAVIVALIAAIATFMKG